MIAYNLEFHNVDHLERVPGMSGLRLERFPEHFKRELGISDNHNGQFRAKRAHGCEIRFVTEAKYFDIGLTAVEADVDIVVYYGDMMHSGYTLKAGVCSVIHVEYPEIYKQADVKRLPKGRFAPYVWRVQFGMNGYIYFHYLDTFGYEHRPPLAEEKPEVLWAAYGSSITCGSVTMLYSNSYIEQAALHLGYDVMNKGLSGSCMCDPAAADYLASLKADVLSLELGVNMLIPFEKDEFESRVRYLLQKVLQESPAKEIFVIDIFRNRGPLLTDRSDPQYRNYFVFKEIVKRLAGEMKDDRVTAIDGHDIAADETCLSTDLLHPSDNGHILMGRNLAERMKGENGYGPKEII